MVRRTVFAVVEGSSENGFLTPLLAPHLGRMGIDFSAKIVGKGAAKGGMGPRTFQQTCREICLLLKDPRQPVVTTFFDFYGFPSSSAKGWEFVSVAKANNVELAVQAIKEAFSTEVRTQLGGKIPSERFLPYVQLHELEALFFAEPEVLAETLGASGREAEFTKIVADCRGCESINDSPNTAPSKRLQNLAPQYVKGRSEAAHAPRLGNKMDLAKIRRACPRFDRWLARLEAGGTTR